MTLYYFDADAQVKYFVNEAGSAWIRRQIDETEPTGRFLHSIATVEISQIEVSAALAILRRLGHIGGQLRDRALRDYLNLANSRFRLIVIDATLVSEATLLPRSIHSKPSMPFTSRQPFGSIVNS